MKETRDIMGMPITIEVSDGHVTAKDLDEAFKYLTYVDEKFSTYKLDSEITKINQKLIRRSQYSADMRLVLAACEKTKQETDGYFNIEQNGKIDPSGYVKGWAIQNCANLLGKMGFKNYFVDAGGDIQAAGLNPDGVPWIVGIRNPLNKTEIVKRISLHNAGIATSGTYIRGQHIYNPFKPESTFIEVLSLTVIGRYVVDADRFATAAFAMGKKGVAFIASLTGYEAYSIDSKGIATFTPGFNSYVIPS